MNKDRKRPKKKKKKTKKKTEAKKNKQKKKKKNKQKKTPKTVNHLCRVASPGGRSASTVLPDSFELNCTKSKRNIN